MKVLEAVKTSPTSFDAVGAEHVPTPPPKIDLRDAHAIRREMASVYRDMRAGNIESQEGTRFVYVLDHIRKAYETAEMQSRIDEIERIINHRRKR
jgi:hypothetical protein